MAIVLSAVRGISFCPARGFTSNISKQQRSDTLHTEEIQMTDPVTPLPKREPMDSEFSPEVASLLTHIKDICIQMRDHERRVISLGQERRQTVTRLRDHGVTWRKIAEWAGTTDQALYKHHNRDSK